MALDEAANNAPVVTEGVDLAEMVGLTYAADHDPGISRRRAGKGFAYRWPDGGLVRDVATLARIRSLAIPPAYTSVWICPDPKGHIQATGRDGRGRKQYRYHPLWRSVRDQGKYARLSAFGRALPRIRAQVEADLALPGLPRDKVLALVVRLLELTLIRVGNDEYARVNGHYGLTTLLDRHARFDANGVSFVFRGKSGVEHRVRASDRRLARIVRACQEVPGQRLFQYVDTAGERHPVGSSDVNAYIRRIAGEDFSAKDFRTWAGTLAAAKALAALGPPEDAASAKRALAACVKAASQILGNTPAVCRSAYIHPEVTAAYGEARLPPAFAECEGEALEAALLAFLNGDAAPLSTTP